MTRITVQPFHWNCIDDEEFIIRCWSLDRNNEPCLINIRGYKPFINIEVLESNSNFANLALGTLYKMFRIHSMETIYRKKLYDHTGKQYPIIHIKFDTLKDLEYCTSVITKGVTVKEINKIVQFNILERKITHLRKFLTFINCEHSQWIEINNAVHNVKYSTLQNEYECYYVNITPLDSSKTMSYITKPSILSIDIECYSKEYKFPDANYSSDVIFMTSLIFEKNDKIQKYIIFLRHMEYMTNFDDVNVINVDNDVEMCDKISDLIHELNPDIIMGYNIYRFDIPYLDIKLERKGREWKSCGRIMSSRALLTRDINRRRNEAMSYVFRQHWESSAYGLQELSILNITGRLTLDLYPFVQREYKLDKYTLDYVSEYFLNEKKHDVSALDMFKAYDAYRDRNDITEIMRVARYCIQDSLLVLKLYHKLNFWITLIELSNVVSIPIMDVYSRGQQLRFLNQLYTETYKRGIVIDNRKNNSNTSFKGAFVYDPTPGIYDHVICLDFSSLYPSIIRRYNICYTTFVSNDSNTNVPDDECYIIECEEEGIKYRYKFLKSPKGLLPQLCENLVAMRSKVRATQKPLQDSMGNPRDNLTNEEKLSYLIAEKRQLALKVCANSVFGALGAANGYLQLIEGARSVCSIGQKLILNVNSYLQTNYNANIVYNDTDSTMFNIPGINDYKTTIEFGDKMQKEISGLFGDPLKMEFEKAGRMFPMCKKRYVFWLVDRDTYKLKMKNGKPVMLNKGNILARRDSCKWQKQVYEDTINMIMNQYSLDDVLLHIQQNMIKLITKQVKIDNLFFIKSIKPVYKSDTYYMKVFLDHNDDKIDKIVTNRIEYVVVDNNEVSLGKKIVLLDMFKNSNNNYRLDNNYYINASCKQLNDLVLAGYKTYIEQWKRYYEEKFWARLLFDSVTKYPELFNVVCRLQGSNSEKFMRLMDIRGYKTKLTALKRVHSAKDKSCLKIDDKCVARIAELCKIKEQIVRQLDNLFATKR